MSQHPNSDTLLRQAVRLAKRARKLLCSANKSRGSFLPNVVVCESSACCFGLSVGCAESVKMPPKKIPKLEVGQKKISFAKFSVSGSPTCESNVSPTPSTSVEGSDTEADTRPCTSSSTESEKAVPRCWQERWLLIYPWLRYDSSKNEMYCDLCRKNKKKNAMATGTDNFRTSTLTRHVQGSDHQLLSAAPKEKERMKTCTKAALTKQEQALIVAFKSMFWLCQENLPISKFRSLMQFLTELGVPNIEHLQCKDTVDYTSNSSADSFLSVLSDLIDEEISQKVKQSPVVTVFVDESTDIVVHHKLAINVRVVDPLSLQPSTFFLTDVRLSAATGKGMFDVIHSELDKRGISLTKVYGLGTDGAAAMTGTKTGLTGHFLEANAHIHNTHCSAHRVALVSEQAAEKVAAVKTFRETITSVYYYFHKSPTKSDALEEVQKVLDDPVLKYKEVHAIRWLSFFLALETVYKTLDSLITLFESRKQQDPKAVGLLKKVAQEMFIKLSYSMMDWLQPIMALSLFFQQKNIDISVVKVNVETCITDLEKMRDNVNELDKPRYIDTLAQHLRDGSFKGHTVARNANHFETVKRDFLQAMIDNLRQRFPDTEKVARMSVFGMKPLQFLSSKDLETWGNEEVEELADFYTAPQSHPGSDGFEYVSVPLLECTTGDIMKEWNRCKNIVKSNHYPVHSLNSLWEALANLQQDGSLECSNLIKLASIVLTHPVHSCDCERTFSVQNLTQTALRNRLSPDKLSQLMRVKIEGGDMKNFNFLAAVEKWRGEKRRALFPNSK